MWGLKEGRDVGNMEASKHASTQAGPLNYHKLRMNPRSKIENTSVLLT